MCPLRPIIRAFAKAHEILFLPQIIVCLYDKRHVRLAASRATSLEFPAAWSSFVHAAKNERLASEVLGTTYVAFVLGCLQTSSLTPDAFTTFLGITCIVASVFSTIYHEVYHLSMLCKSDPWHGLAWASESKNISRLSWKSTPKLLAVPVAYFIWATVTLIVFTLAEAWIGLGDGSSTTPPSSAKFILSVLITVEILMGLVQASYIIPAFLELGRASGYECAYNGQSGEVV
ncbi:hypothetical protein DAEQUDRAFT_807900 [Daedalea quercina L-15889]|uniref:Uncharacterized protein n=1 Tax=Daedalea quercina L-15889 TaxID=1314783 RepID=A0A165U0X7_9APHY|nr:hypothetical protein DAEQUDRAFT_807900 [Daedalea quercina L-15889]